MSDVDAKLTEIRERHKAATPAPWFVDQTDGRSYPWICQSPDDANPWLIVAEPENYVIPEEEDLASDAEFIAHAPEDIGWLLRAVDRLRGMLADRVNEVQRLKERLAELEWAGTDLAWYPENVPVCPVCKGLKEGTDAGHRGPDEHDEKGCWLGAMLHPKTTETTEGATPEA